MYSLTILRETKGVSNMENRPLYCPDDLMKLIHQKMKDSQIQNNQNNQDGPNDGLLDHNPQIIKEPKGAMLNK